MTKLFILLFLINIFEIYSYNLNLFPLIRKLLNKPKKNITVNKYNDYILNRILLDIKVDKIVGKKNITK
jgi:hypothetical protein